MMTPRDNYVAYLKGQPHEWTPTMADQRTFRPTIFADHIARGMVVEQNPYTGEYGGKDIFGCEWVFEKAVGGSMEVGTSFDEIDEWEDKVVFPDLDSWDWEGCAERNKDFLNTDKLISTTIYTGFFERLISFIGFEESAMALVDEDSQECVHALFDKLADLYIDIIARMHKYFNVELVEIHDDWGTQRSPMFSEDTHAEMIVPYVRKVVNAAHEMGVFMEMHSCGMIEPLIPNLISTNIDVWRGQAINDRHKLVDLYGDQFKFGVEIRPADPVDDETAMKLVAHAYEEWAGKNVWIAIGRPFTPAQQAMMGQYVREHGVLNP